ncbi:hypothetical protein JAO76_12410 [Pontibacter sp. BT310]|uniref:Helicase C-terminal domain-containing protein n=1 Tax=Pontibacter populi TaxID=890055 RepID=A0ABS6XF89_9BACT|nr:MULTISPECIES: helicase-related protein [Pontibacter]MBJ6119001.1 hypothetical protein [Pontibacter sp. BT310]MBR0571429.1 hypothetical protein [Microvirga sp. STS03]MBW3365855.1 helicase C-terminal domain-containing protein [Pontibacter populi]
MPSKYEDKRNSLERTIREQILGPGANANRYILLSEWESHYAGKNLKELFPIDNLLEVMDEVPAYYYSTGILFPSTVEAKPDNGQGQQNNTASGDDENGAGDDDFHDNKEESLSSLNQNYPTSFGLSFAIDKNCQLQEDLELKVEFRTYRPVKGEALKEVGYWVRSHQAVVKEVINKYFTEYLKTVEKEENLFIVSTRSEISREDAYRLDYDLFERFQHEYLSDARWEQEKQEHTLAPKNRYGYETRYLLLNDADGWVSKIRERFLAQFLPAWKKGNIKAKAYDQELIARVEVVNLVKDMVEAFKKNFNVRKSAMWKATPQVIHTTLPAYGNSNREIGQKLVYGSDDSQSPKLELFWQYIMPRFRNSEDKDKIYIKLVIKNVSQPYKLKLNEPPQLNKKNKANIKSFFGIRLTVAESEAGSNVLRAYNPPNLSKIDQEDNFNKLLYRQYEDLGEGYNTSVAWGTSEDGRRFICTEFLPATTTPQVDHTPSKLEGGTVKTRLTNTDILRIKPLSTLSKLSDTAITECLRSFVKDYSTWIEEKQRELCKEGLSTEGTTILNEQLLKASSDERRLRRNIGLLEGDRDAMAAFRLMNTAMFLQIHHSLNIKQAKKSNLAHYLVAAGKDEEAYKALEDTIPGNSKAHIAWRPFQLAFVLLNIDAFVKPGGKDEVIHDDIFDSGWHERNGLADLVWFPTGGGKTEAYLGIIAFLIAYRRMTKGVDGTGTAILMRYTLRLLTLQQFQRATLLICALEHIRKESFSIPNHRSLGKERITIGLYVGNDSLPGAWTGGEKSMEAELRRIAQQIDQEERQIKTKLPHTDCPWCGSELFTTLHKDALSNVLEPDSKKSIPLRFFCHTSGCSFEDMDMMEEENSLPLRLYDEEIYKYPPTLLFGTVDKFAQLAHNVENGHGSDSRRIFGQRRRGNNLLPSVTPPELIIQDELHLLLGPLGSAVGLFETAIDELCTYSKDGLSLRPKIITSTATTRNTKDQIYALFDREVQIFPKAGIHCDDSFFAYYKRASSGEYLSTRKYVGILPVGKTQVWMQLRIAAVVLAHRYKYLYEQYSSSDLYENGITDEEFGRVMDYYHTMLMYFNSLKEVGKTESQLYHYLPNEVNLIRRNITDSNFFDPLLSPTDNINHSELTGRLSGEEVKSNLSAIERNWELQNAVSPPEFVIATNMISVGIDVSRFNTMVISSMPRNIAEYIQASSRVAREKEGLVLTVHHPFRSRDLSHYQRFVEFHEKFYSYVEPISVTPYTFKALKRYLPLFLATWIRHKGYGLSTNEQAGMLNENLKDTIVNEVVQHFKTLRKHSSDLKVIGILDDNELLEIQNEVHKLMTQMWLERIGQGQGAPEDFRYKTDSPNTSIYIVGNSYDVDLNWNVKGSLREVAPETVIKTVQQ